MSVHLPTLIIHYSSKFFTEVGYVCVCPCLKIEPLQRVFLLRLSQFSDLQWTGTMCVFSLMVKQAQAKHSQWLVKIVTIYVLKSKLLSVCGSISNGWWPVRFFFFFFRMVAMSSRELFHVLLKRSFVKPLWIVHLLSPFH